MADDKKDGEEEQKDSGGKKKIIIFAGIGVLLLGLGIGGTMFFMGSKEVPGEEGMDEMAEAEMAEEPEMAIYHELHPAFVANFSGKSKKKYMQVYIVALANQESVIEDLELHMPAVRNDVLMTLSRVSSDQIETVEGKEELRQQVLTTVKETMKMKTGKEESGIQDLYFTKFVAQ